MRLISLIFNFTLFVACLTAETNYAIYGNENLQKLSNKNLSQNPNSDSSIRKKMVQAQWISKGIAESKSAGTKDLLFENATLFGKYGGTCKCGDTEYFVADENNDCKSLACYNGGEAGQCRIQYVYRWAYHGVICNGKDMMNNEEEKIVWKEESYRINHDTPIVVNWDRQTICDTTNKNLCIQFATCQTNNYEKWVCTVWDEKNKIIHDYQYDNCSVDDGIGYCDGLTTRNCQQKEGYFNDKVFTDSRLYSCTMDNDLERDFDNCEMMNTTNIVRCCESNVQDSKVCYHFNTEQEFKSKLTMVRMNPKPKKAQSKNLASNKNTKKKNRNNESYLSKIGL